MLTEKEIMQVVNDFRKLKGHSVTISFMGNTDAAGKIVSRVIDVYFSIAGKPGAGFTWWTDSGLITVDFVLQKLKEESEKYISDLQKLANEVAELRDENEKLKQKNAAV